MEIQNPAMETTNPIDAAEQPSKKPDSGRYVQAESVKYPSEDCVEMWEGGAIVCDGAGGECNPRLASVVVSRVTQFLSKRLKKIQGDKDGEFERVCESIIARATGALAYKAEKANTLSTLDVVHIDQGNRLHVAHRGDGVVMVLDMQERRGEMVTTPSDLQSSIADSLRGFVSPIGSRKEWGFLSWKKEAEFIGAILDIEEKGERKKVILEHLKSYSVFPEMFKDSTGKIFKIREAIAEKALAAISENHFLLSDDTEFYHRDCKPNELVIAMSDGVFDNLVWMAQVKSFMKEGFTKEEAKDLITRLSQETYSRDSITLIMAYIEDRFHKLFCEKGSEKFIAWERKFMDISHWYKEVPTLLAKLIYKLQEQSGQHIKTADEFAAMVTNIARNKFKKDDASTAVLVVNSLQDSKIPVQSSPAL